MIKLFRVMTFLPNGHPTPLEYKKHLTKEAAEQRLEEIKKSYDLPLYVSGSSVN